MLCILNGEKIILITICYQQSVSINNSQCLALNALAPENYTVSADRIFVATRLHMQKEHFLKKTIYADIHKCVPGTQEEIHLEHMHIWLRNWREGTLKLLKCTIRGP